MPTTAIANANIALIKYWGKRDHGLNIPAVGSISVTLEGLSTKTSVEFSRDLSEDRLILNDEVAGPAETGRVSGLLDLIRSRAGSGMKAVVTSSNNFPTAAGLASSASAFAALTVAATTAAGLNLTPAELSILARRGSGSAPRSLFGGFAEMRPGQNADGSDATAIQLFPEEHWDLRVLIAVTSDRPKDTGSTDGMELSRRTSPFYQAWIDSSASDISQMRAALEQRDFEKVADLSEFSCLKMHGLALASNPGLVYWIGSTVEAIHRVRSLRKNGTAVFFTIDAGPQFKAFCLPQAQQEVEGALADIQGVKRIIRTGPGHGARLVSE